MPGFSAKLPLNYDQTDGFYSLNKDLRDVVKQNVKMLVLTNPGERVMDTNFGVGVKKLLFENKTAEEKGRLIGVIRQKIKQYLPFITITNISIADSSVNPLINENAIHLKIEYVIPSLKTIDNIDFILSANTI
jgi:phage baseplate assembly protein W